MHMHSCSYYAKRQHDNPSVNTTAFKVNYMWPIKVKTLAAMLRIITTVEAPDERWICEDPS